MTFWQIAAGLGVPGFALAVLLTLLKRMDFKFPMVPRSWTGPIVVLFLLIVATVTIVALILFSPSRSLGAERPSITSVIEPFPNGAKVLSQGSENMNHCRNEMRSGVTIETVLVPVKPENNYRRIYDLYLENGSDNPILLNRVYYSSRVTNPGGEPSEPAHAEPPNYHYKIAYNVGTMDIVALQPPYRIPAHTRGAFRITFEPSDRKWDKEDWLIHSFQFALLDSKGRNVAIDESLEEKSIDDYTKDALKAYSQYRAAKDATTTTAI